MMMMSRLGKVIVRQLLQLKNSHGCVSEVML